MEMLNTIQQALSYIDDCLGEKISGERLAEISYLSPYYFRRIFKAATGKAPALYIRDRRLEKACLALAKSDSSALEK